MFFSRLSQNCFTFLMNLSVIIPADERLADFRILIGNKFSQEITEAADIGTWPECAYVSGK